MIISWSQTLYNEKWIEIGQLFSRKKLISQILFEIRDRHNIFILNIHTKESFRKQGFARIFLKSLFSTYPRYNFELEIIPHGKGKRMNHAQLERFYCSLGFKRINNSNFYKKKRFRNHK